MRGKDWTSKIIDFYNGERRFIFAAKDEEIGLAWVDEINRAVLGGTEYIPQSQLSVNPGMVNTSMVNTSMVQTGMNQYSMNQRSLTQPDYYQDDLSHRGA